MNSNRYMHNEGSAAGRLYWLRIQVVCRTVACILSNLVRKLARNNTTLKRNRDGKASIKHIGEGGTHW